jgi:hypothetical protein
MAMIEGSSTTDAEQQCIIRELAQLQALVTAIPPGTPLDFRAIHAVASRLTQAAYEGWKQEALAATARKPLSKAVGEPTHYPHQRRSDRRV